MKVVTFEGFVENGQIRLSGGVRLPDKTRVYVVVPDVEVASAAYIGSPRLAHREQADDFKKEVGPEGPNLNSPGRQPGVTRAEDFQALKGRPCDRKCRPFGA